MSVSREDVEYWQGGSRLRGWFYPTRDAPGPAIVFCPGYTGTKFAAFYTPYVERFVAAGWNVLLSDYRGWGESDGPRGEIVPMRQVADIRAGLTYLQTRSEVDETALSVFGVSFGGGVAVYTASIDSRVRTCVAVSAVADGSDWLRRMRREYEWYEFLDFAGSDQRKRVGGGEATLVDPANGLMIPTPERRSTKVKGQLPPGLEVNATPLWCALEIMDFRPIDVVQRLAPRALLLFSLSADAVVPPAHSQSLFSAASEPKRLVSLKGEAHYGAYIEHLEAISTGTIDWLRNHGTVGG